MNDTAVAGTPALGARLLLELDELLLEILPSAVYVCNAEGAILRYNRKAAELWGRAPRLGENGDRFCGSHRLLWPDGRELPRDATPMAETLRTGEPVQGVELIVEQPGGARVWVAVNIEALRDAAGKIVGAVNSFHDITGRKQAEFASRESRAFLEAVFETTPECIQVLAADGRLIQINPAGLAMLEAAEPKAVLGRSMLDQMPAEDATLWRRNVVRVCAGERRRWEGTIIGLGGTRREAEIHAAPLPMPDGRTAVLAVLRDVTRRKRDEQALRASEARLRDILEALPTAVYTTDAEGRISFFNGAAAELWGHRPDEDELWCGSWRLYRPDGSRLPHDECPMAICLKEGRAVRDQEALLERPDGVRIPFMPYPTPLRDPDGRLAGAVNMLVDISYHKKAADRQQLLINELNHRVRNTLATVQSIAHATLLKASSPASFRDAFEGRLSALSKAHDLLTSQHWESVDLQAVLDEELMPYVTDKGRQLRLEGRPVRLGAREALTLAMAFHELATNAVKYGALSSGDGYLQIEWAEDPSGRLAFRWAEHGGPPVAPPLRRGFGSTLLERSIRSSMGGTLQLDYDLRGFRCFLTVPIRAGPAGTPAVP